MQLCVWDPVNDKPAEECDGVTTGCKNIAAVCVGSKINWHLCFECAGLSVFNKFRTRTPLHKTAAAFMKGFTK